MEQDQIKAALREINEALADFDGAVAEAIREQAAKFEARTGLYLTAVNVACQAQIFDTYGRAVRPPRYLVTASVERFAK